MSTATVTTSVTPATTRSATDLLSRAGEGDPRAWEEIIRRYSATVFARVRSFRLQDADALDAVQMTWLRLAENCHRIRSPERLGGWLATTATRECIRILRHGKRTTAGLSETTAEHLVDSSAGPEQRVIDAETTQTLRSFVAELAPRQRNLLRTLFTEDPPSYAELVLRTGIPAGSIGPTRARALQHLQRMLTDHGLGPAA